MVKTTGSAAIRLPPSHFAQPLPAHRPASRPATPPSQPACPPSRHAQPAACPPTGPARPPPSSLQLRVERAHSRSAARGWPSRRRACSCAPGRRCRPAIRRISLCHLLAQLLLAGQVHSQCESGLVHLLHDIGVEVLAGALLGGVVSEMELSTDLISLVFRSSITWAGFSPRAVRCGPHLAGEPAAWGADLPPDPGCPPRPSAQPVEPLSPPACQNRVGHAEKILHVFGELAAKNEGAQIGPSMSGIGSRGAGEHSYTSVSRSDYYFRSSRAPKFGRMGCITIAFRCSSKFITLPLASK